MKRYSAKGLAKRQEERKGFPEFYTKHINFIKENRVCCAECGIRLMGDVSEVAHILDKGYFKSVSTEDQNIIYLCSWKSNNNCHSKFDNSSLDVFKDMLIYKFVCNRFAELVGLVKEKINYKVRERYE